MNTSSQNNAPANLEASKWLQLQVLLDAAEMDQLLEAAGDATLFTSGRVVAEGAEKIPTELFLEKYCAYIDQLKSGAIPDVSVFRPFFSTSLTLADDHLFALPAGEGKRIVRVIKPVVQCQLHLLGYSALEKKFRPMILGKDSIHWGLQFSYPQLCRNPETGQVDKVFAGGQFPNTRLFRAIQGWIRKHTVPTPFLVDGERINVPIRLGRMCLPWIRSHPQLQALGISVKVQEEADNAN